ncbi:hypothetical protein ACJX0J_034577, partial [Zea mays]
MLLLHLFRRGRWFLSKFICHRALFEEVTPNIVALCALYEMHYFFKPCYNAKQIAPATKNKWLDQNNTNFLILTSQEEIPNFIKESYSTMVAEVQAKVIMFKGTIYASINFDKEPKEGLSLKIAIYSFLFLLKKYVYLIAKVNMKTSFDLSKCIDGAFASLLRVFTHLEEKYKELSGKERSISYAQQITYESLAMTDYYNIMRGEALVLGGFSSNIIIMLRKMIDCAKIVMKIAFCTRRRLHRHWMHFCCMIAYGGVLLFLSMFLATKRLCY